MTSTPKEGERRVPQDESDSEVEDGSVGHVSQPTLSDELYALDQSTPMGEEREAPLNGHLTLEHVHEVETLPPEPNVPGITSPTSSIPDDTPSLKGSARSTPSDSVSHSRISSRISSSPSLQPFDRRFKARASSSSLVQRALSPAFLTPHSRQSSVSSQITQVSEHDDFPEGEAEEHAPWDIIRWEKLAKLSSQLSSGKKAFGDPTYLVIAGSIALGTSKGYVLVFDYHQNLKCIIGQGTQAAEAGRVASLALSADHSMVASGHVDGSVFTWDLARPSKPFLHIPPIPVDQLARRTIDGHIAGSAVLHIGFLGQRRTALVTADDTGMGFSHLASRGLGAVSRTIKTKRLLGRYPTSPTGGVRTKKPSTVLAFAPLPLGNVEQLTDEMGLTALLTPYLLVVVSTMPEPQTQFKTSRAKDVVAHGAMTGCLSWFPAVRLKDSSTSEQKTSKTKLVYCWSNVLSVLEVEAHIADPEDEKQRPNLTFQTRSHWKCDEAILAVQWISRSILAVLTFSQRLVILEDVTMRVADILDLNAKYIYHHDLFSQQLQLVVDDLEGEDASLHGFIPDAYHMSVKAYKGRLFILSPEEVHVGTLSNWADRLYALMHNHLPVEAIELATSYYNGDTERITVGLPEDDSSRHIIVKERLEKLITASLAYIFNQTKTSVAEDEFRDTTKRLARACFSACLSMGDSDLLLNDVYDWFSDTSSQIDFLLELEKRINSGEIDLLPPLLAHDLIGTFNNSYLAQRLEDILCALKPYTLDIGLVTAICKKYKLYDALIHVWNQGLNDYVVPLYDMMKLMIYIGESGDQPDARATLDFEVASKTFPYLAFILTGRSYPDGEELSISDAAIIQSCVYGFLFAEDTIRWPLNGGELLDTPTNDAGDHLYPYLQVLLKFDISNFMSMLNEAFEDSFLDGNNEEQIDMDSIHELQVRTFGPRVTRAKIVRILLRVIKTIDFSANDRIYLDMFISRNIPKYSQGAKQLIHLTDSEMTQILVELCEYPHPDLKEECQLSVEYLLAGGLQTDQQELNELLRRAGFFRVLKSSYRASKDYARWLEAHFEDQDDPSAVFECISTCLRPSSGLSKRQIRDVRTVLHDHLRQLTSIDAQEAALSLQSYVPDFVEDALMETDRDSQSQYTFMKALMEPKGLARAPQSNEAFAEQHRTNYIRLMCLHDPQEVAKFVTVTSTANLHLDDIIPAMEASGVIDAAVTLLAREGLASDAMKRLVKHLGVLESALDGLVTMASHGSEYLDANDETSGGLLEEIDKYIKIGIWLCQGQASTESPPAAKAAKSRRKSPVDVSEDDLTIEEKLWLDLIDMSVRISRSIAAASRGPENGEQEEQPPVYEGALDINKISGAIRMSVQQAFTSLLAATSPVVAQSSAKADKSLTRPSATSTLETPSAVTQRQKDARFLRILACFLTRLAATTTSLADLQASLSDIFSAYAFEASLLSLSQSLLASDVFAKVEAVNAERRRGWRPRSAACDHCGKRIWGRGLGMAVFEAWSAEDARRKEGLEQEVTRWRAGEVDWMQTSRRSSQNRTKSEDRSSRSSKAKDGYIDKGKGKEGAVRTGPPLPPNQQQQQARVPASDSATKTQRPDSIVVFACHHAFHSACLEIALQGRASKGRGGSEFVCPACDESD